MLSLGQLKIKNNLFLILVVFLLSTSNLFAAMTFDQLKAYVSSVVQSALGSAVPAPIGLVADIAQAVPSGYEGMMIAYIRTEQSNLGIKYVGLTLPPLDKEELDLRENELQAILALVSDGGNTKSNRDYLQKILKEKKQLEKKRKQKKKDDIKKDDIDTIKLLLKDYQNRLLAIDKWNQDIQKCEEKVSKSLLTLRSLYTSITKPIEDKKQALNIAKLICDDAKNTQNEIITFTDKVESFSNLIKEKITYAKDMFIICETSIVEADIENNYNLAKKYLAEMKFIYEDDVQRNLEILKLKLDDVKQINERLKTIKAQDIKRDIQEYDKISKDNNFCEEKFINEKDKVKDSLKALREEVIDTQQYYINEYPNETKEITALLNNVDKSYAQYSHISTKFADTLTNYESRQRANFPLRIYDDTMRCIELKPSGERVKKAGKLYINARELVQANSSLLDGCVKKTTPVTTTVIPPKTDKTKPPSTPTSSNPTNNSTNTNNTNEYTAYDTVRIAGPTQLYVGDAVAYTAFNPNNSDATYTTGSFTWNNTRQDLLSLGASGNPVSGVAIKAGKFTIQLTYGQGGVAYLDGVIKEKKKKKNLFNMSGIEEDNAANKPPKKIKKNLFSMSGIEETKNDRCEEYLSEAKALYQSGNLDATQAIINRASGCGWTGEAQAKIDKKRRKRKCDNIVANMQNACNSRDSQKIRAAQSQAAQEQCRIDQNLWQLGSNIISANTQRINEQYAQAQQQASSQPQQQTNQASAVDLLNVIAGGIRSVQQQQQRNDRVNRNDKPTISSNIGSYGTRNPTTSSNSSGVRTSNQVSQIIYRVSGSGYIPHYGGKSYRVQGYHDVLVSIKAPNTKESILRKAQQKYNTDPCKVGISATPSSKRPPAIWESGPQIKLMKGPSTDLSNVRLQNTWRSLGNDGPPLSTLRKSKGCR